MMTKKEVIVAAAATEAVQSALNQTSVVKKSSQGELAADIKDVIE